jgi:hypothetical protein
MGENVKPDVVIVSAFGRGNWMAAELAGKAVAVQLVDVTDHLGRWAPEDWEGPFGFFRHDDLLSSQVTRLTEEDYHDELADGFTVWVKEGPLDMRGHLANYWLDKIPGYALSKKYIQTFHTVAKADLEDVEDDLLNEGFAKNWIAQLAHQLASPVFTPNALGLQEGEPLPLFAPFAIRRVTRKGLAKSLDWCRSLGVEVLGGAKLVDVALEGRNCVGVQFGGDVARVVQAENFVWCLSSAETQFLAPNATAHFFPKGVLNPEWSWMRWRVQGQLGNYAGAVPAHFVMIDDLGLPWTHANLLIVQRCEVDGKFDVWARIPAHHRFQRGFCEEFGREIAAKLDGRIPNFKCAVQDQPQDYHYDVSELGPSLLPVFDAATRAAWSPRGLKNVEFDGVEAARNLDWTGRFARQNQIVAKLLKWKQARLAKLEKGGGRDRSIHPS